MSGKRWTLIIEGLILGAAGAVSADPYLVGTAIAFGLGQLAFRGDTDALSGGKYANLPAEGKPNGRGAR